LIKSHASYVPVDLTNKIAIDS